MCWCRLSTRSGRWVSCTSIVNRARARARYRRASVILVLASVVPCWKTVPLSSNRKEILFPGFRARARARLTIDVHEGPLMAESSNRNQISKNSYQIPQYHIRYEIHYTA